MTTNDNMPELIRMLIDRIQSATKGFSDDLIAPTLLTESLAISAKMNISKDAVKKIMNDYIDNFYEEMVKEINK